MLKLLTVLKEIRIYDQSAPRKELICDLQKNPEFMLLA